MDLEAALAWKTCTFGFTKKLTTMSRQFIYKKTVELYCDRSTLEAFLFQMNRGNK